MAVSMYTTVFLFIHKHETAESDGCSVKNLFSGEEVRFN